MGRGKADKSAYAKARPYFIKARHLDELDPRPAIGYYLSFREAGEAVPAAAVTALEQVYPEASFDPQYRLLMTRQLLDDGKGHLRSEEHTSELQSLMRISYAVFCL